MTNIPSNELITISEAADILTVNSDTVRLWVKKGVFKRIVHIGPSRLIRLYRAEVEAQRVEEGSRP